MENARRQDHLRDYILACVRDSVLSPADLASPAIVEKLLKVMSSDIRVVLVDLGRAAGKSLLRGVAATLMGIADGRKR